MRGAVPVLLSVHLITIAVTRQVSALNPALRIPPNVSVHAKKTADRQIDNETIDRNKMKDYKREISRHSFS